MSDLLDRLLARDTTLWPKGNVADNRLGWVEVADRMADLATGVQKWADSITHDTIVLIGMGGSSLGPEVLEPAAASALREWIVSSRVNRTGQGDDDPTIVGPVAEAG